MDANLLLDIAVALGITLSCAILALGACLSVAQLVGPR
jgi:hypothetical protein